MEGRECPWAGAGMSGVFSFVFLFCFVLFYLGPVSRISCSELIHLVALTGYSELEGRLDLHFLV